ncbi:hypothetical protein QBC42DRAFT_9791 [Cladorrhinum samala]|uniref:Uncharacterized protein n=1 Tax=Cladorrhinum samala TaxID=585594 RepID=A0AAV9HFH4_9PEZI|nr:hypothetical protein QBC42DRAFT_9791 [Cladorrhinum samala]
MAPTAMVPAGPRSWSWCFDRLILGFLETIGFSYNSVGFFSAPFPFSAHYMSTRPSQLPFKCHFTTFILFPCSSFFAFFSFFFLLLLLSSFPFSSFLFFFFFSFFFIFFFISCIQVFMPGN